MKPGGSSSPSVSPETLDGRAYALLLESVHKHACAHTQNCDVAFLQSDSKRVFDAKRREAPASLEHSAAAPPPHPLMSL